MSADERREEILQAAMIEFARGGLAGTSTETIARRAGISQPYLFRLFGTKKELFLAVVERGFDNVHQTFRLAAEPPSENVLDAMGAAYSRLLAHREALLLQLHAYAACSDPDIQVVVRACFANLYRSVQQLSGAEDEVVRDFFAKGMLLNVAAAMDLPAAIEDESWLRECLGA
jgi:AcrR family transcriptional regulator